MLIGSDLFIAYVKKQDWLKETATGIFQSIEDGRLKGIRASTEVFHELYYVFSDYASVSTILKNAARMATLNNLTYINPTAEIYLSALELMDTYDLTSIFDAMYAATALTDQVPDHTVLSTDKIYERIKGITRKDPTNLERLHDS